MRGYRKHWRCFNATFTYLGSKITVSRLIDEENDYNARWGASQGMLMALREIGLFKNSCIHSEDLVEVRRKDGVSWKDTLEQIRLAEENFKTQPFSTDKMLMIMANAHGVTM